MAGRVRGAHLLSHEELVYAKRHDESPQGNVKHAPRRPSEPQVVVLLVFCPLLDCEVPAKTHMSCAKSARADKPTSASVLRRAYGLKPNGSPTPPIRQQQSDEGGQELRLLAAPAAS